MRCAKAKRFFVLLVKLPHLASNQEITNVEKDIVALFREKDSQALHLIDQHYQRALVGVIMRIVKTEAFVLDIWQESLVKICKYSHSYDPEKGRLFTWLLNICRRIAMDKTRSKVYKESALTPDFRTKKWNNSTDLFPLFLGDYSCKISLSMHSHGQG